MDSGGSREKLKGRGKESEPGLSISGYRPFMPQSYFPSLDISFFKFPRLGYRRIPGEVAKN